MASTGTGPTTALAGKPSMGVTKRGREGERKKCVSLMSNNCRQVHVAWSGRYDPTSRA